MVDLDDLSIDQRDGRGQHVWCPGRPKQSSHSDINRNRHEIIFLLVLEEMTGVWTGGREFNHRN